MHGGSGVPSPAPLIAALIREFTVAVFVVHEGRVLLHRHRKLGLWLPPGGHIDPGELPDDATIRETLEETGVHIQLLDGPLALPDGHAVAPDEPARLIQPLGIQLEDISPGHQHIDLIYVARPLVDRAIELTEEAGSAGLGWYAPEEWECLGVTGEVQGWARAAIAVHRSQSSGTVQGSQPGIR